jgi:hypothetical protein
MCRSPINETIGDTVNSLLDLGLITPVLTEGGVSEKVDVTSSAEPPSSPKL